MDVYFQKDLNADLNFKKLNGGIYSDFEVTALPQAGGRREPERQVCVPHGPQAAGRAGKGGPELSFDTLNGNIRLHSKANSEKGNYA